MREPEMGELVWVRDFISEGSKLGILIGEKTFEILLGDEETRLSEAYVVLIDGCRRTVEKSWVQPAL